MKSPQFRNYAFASAHVQELRLHQVTETLLVHSNVSNVGTMVILIILSPVTVTLSPNWKSSMILIIVKSLIMTPTTKRSSIMRRKYTR